MFALESQYLHARPRGGLKVVALVWGTVCKCNPEKYTLTQLHSLSFTCNNKSIQHDRTVTQYDSIHVIKCLCVCHSTLILLRINLMHTSSFTPKSCHIQLFNSWESTLIKQMLHVEMWWVKMYYLFSIHTFCQDKLLTATMTSTSFLCFDICVVSLL